MILIIPAIELKNGLPSHRISNNLGETGSYGVFEKDPRKLCELLRRENAKSIHIMDYDSIYGLKDEISIGTITHLSQCVDIPFEFFADFKSADECRTLLEQGIYRLILDEITLTKPDDVKSLIKEFGATRIIFNVWIKDEKICLGNKLLDMSLDSYISRIKSLGGKRIVYGEAAWENISTGPDMDKLAGIALRNKIRITVANGVTKAEHLWQLNEMQKFGVDSVILGESLYNNNFPCQKIWRLIEAEIEDDVKQ